LIVASREGLMVSQSLLTAAGHVRFTPEKRTYAVQKAMSALGQ
jgi:hypothetical protein